MINPQWLKLPMHRTNFYGPKDVQAIEVWLYIELKIIKTTTLEWSVAMDLSDA